LEDTFAATVDSPLYGLLARCGKQPTQLRWTPVCCLLYGLLARCVSASSHALAMLLYTPAMTLMNAFIVEPLRNFPRD